MYQLTPNPAIVARLDDSAFIPADPLNRDYAEYQEWLAQGNVPDPAPAQPVVIPDITKRQMLLWLLAAGKTEADVTAAIGAIADPTARAGALITWQYPDHGLLQRSNPLFDQLGPAFGLSAGQIDGAFAAAAGL